MSTEQQVNAELIVLPAVMPLEEKLQWAIQELARVNAQSEEYAGRRYTTVADRVFIFRRAFGPLASISTDIEQCDDQIVRATAVISLLDHAGNVFVVAEGHAKEFWDSNEVNQTSALENAETSAIGRALANLGLHGGEFASANELASALGSRKTSQADEATGFLKSEDITDATQKIAACKTQDELAETYLKLSPALKVACRAAKDAKLRSFSAPTSGSAPERADSPPPPSEPPSASPQRRARSSGAA